MPSFGTKNKDSKGFDGDVWLKGFKDGFTTVQIAEPVAEWVKYFEHYDPDAGKKGAFFACARVELGDCEGCNSDNERTKKAGVKWAFNGIDDQGRYNLYKVGAKIKKQMELREQTKGLDITTKEWEISRSGSGLETEYMSEAQGPAKYEVDESKFTDAGPILAKTYFDYLEVIKEDAPETDGPDQEPVAPVTEPEQEGQDVADKVREEQADKIDPVAEQRVNEGQGEDYESDPETWASDKLRAYVVAEATKRGDDIPGNRTARSKLVASAKIYQSNPPF